MATCGIGSRGGHKALVAWAAGSCLWAACANRQRPHVDTDGMTAADKHYDVAVGSFHNGMLEDAKLQLAQALEADPKHADSYYLRGVLLLQEGKTLIDAVEHEQCLEDAAAQQQRDRAQQLHRDAAAAFEAAVANYPDGAAGRGRALNSLAVVALHFDEHEAAATRAKDALTQRFYADRYSALANLGWAYHGQGDLISATSELRQSVLLNPDYCVGRYRLAEVYLETNLSELAAEQAQQVIDDSRCPIQDAYRVLGAAQLRLGLDDAARASFAGCVALAPRSCLARQCARLGGAETPSGSAEAAP